LILAELVIDANKQVRRVKLAGTTPLDPRPTVNCIEPLTTYSRRRNRDDCGIIPARLFKITKEETAIPLD
jgi:hypothetical protein